MKTTLNVRDDLFRRAKARAALRGISLGRFLEESLERMLREGPQDSGSWSEWARQLPSVSEAAAADLRAAVADGELRVVDPEMWT